MTIVLVAVAGGLGAVLRAVAGWLDRELPVGTLAVNVIGSFGLARLVATESDLAVVIGTGGFGALTTWSAVAVAAVAGQQPMARRALILAAAVGVPIAAAWVGLVLG